MCCLLLVLVAVLSPLCAAAPLELPNPSFEIDADGDGLPDGWQLRGTTDLGEAHLDDTEVAQGQRSVKMVGFSPDARLFLEAARMAVNPGAMYLFECRIKSQDVKSGNPVVGFGRYTRDGQWDDWSYALTAPSNRDWQLYRQVFTIPPTTASAAFRVWIEHFEGTAWFDDLKISEYDPGEPGFVDRFTETSAWSTVGGRLEPSDDGAKLVSERQADFETLFPVASMRRPLPEAAAEYPVLRIDIASVKGLWALKVRDRGYLQQAQARPGIHLYDLNELRGTRGGPAAYIEVQAIGDLAEVTVREVSLLRELPPSVPVETTYTDHYVQNSGPVDGLDLSREHPYVAVSGGEIESAREKGEAYLKWLDGIVARADKVCESTYEVPEQGYFYSMHYNCPKHGVPLTWRPDHPHEHVCPVDREVITGPEFDRQWRIQNAQRVHGDCRSALRSLGMAYAHTGTEKYAEKARGILLDYADKFPNYLWHGGRGDLRAEGNGMRVAYEPLGEAGWLADIAEAYDLVAASPAFSEDERGAIEEMLREDVRVSLRYDERLSNRQCHHNLAVAAVGLCLKDETLVRRAVGSFRHQLKYAILGDGLWWECSPGYHYYAVNTMLELVQMLKRAGLDLTREPKLKLAFDGPLHFLFPDGYLPGVNDANWHMKPPWQRYEYLYSIFEDPRYVPLLERQDRTGAHEYLLYGKELGEGEPLPAESHLLFKAGMAMLKAGPEADALAVAFDWGQTVAGHGHADKLNVVVHGNGELLGLDNGSRSYFSPVWRFWDRQTLAHNTVVVNERSQLHRKGRLELFDRQPALSVCQATADEVYPGLRLRRTLFVTPDYAVDLFRVVRDSTDLAVREEPANLIPGWRKEPWGDSSPQSLARDFARFERSTDAHTGAFSAMLGQTQLATAAWATNLRHVTGPNSEYRYAVTPVEPGSYRFAVWVKTQDATGANQAQLEWMDDRAGVLERVTLDVPDGTSDWQELSQEAMAPAGATAVGVRLSSDGNAGSVWFDDLSLVPRDGGENVLTRNPDLETTDADTETIDWTYHNVGELTCDVATEMADFSIGKDVDEPYLDGENGYRYMRDLRAGIPAGESWRARWVTDPATGRGLELTMVGEPGTQVITADGQGPGTMTVPLVVARRREPDTVFATVLEPTAGEGSRIRAVRRLECTTDEGQSPAAGAYGVAVELADRTDYYLASYRPVPCHFGPVDLDPGEANRNCVAMVSVSDGRPIAMYLLGGEKLTYRGWSLEGAGALHGRVLACDEAAGTIATDASLPPGQALRGSALAFDLPHNVCFAVDSVQPSEAGSTIKFAGMPNLWLTPGMRFSIPVPVFVAEKAPGVLFHRAPAGSALTLPDAARGRVEYEDAEGKLRSLDVTREGDGRVISFTPEMLGDGRTHILLDRPPRATLDDAEPPRVVAVSVNGRELAPAPQLTIPYAAREVAVQFEDAASGLLAGSLRVMVNGQPASAQEGVTAREVLTGSRARVSVAVAAEASIETLGITISDDGLLRNQATFSLRVVRAAEIADMKEASGGKAVRMFDAAGYLETKLELAAGEYAANLISSGPSLSANSIWLHIDGEQVADPIHLPVGELGNSSREVEMTDKLTRFRVERDGQHTLRLTLREGPGPLLDKLRIMRGGRVVHEVECEDMLP